MFKVTETNGFIRYINIKHITCVTDTNFGAIVFLIGINEGIYLTPNSSKELFDKLGLTE